MRPLPGRALPAAGGMSAQPAPVSAIRPGDALVELLREPGVTDVLVNAPDQVWVDRGQGLERAGLHLGDERAVRSLAQRWVAAAGRRLDDARPFADAVLADGVRLHAVLAPVAVGGTALSLRVPRRVRFRLDDLVAVGTVPAGAAPWLQALMQARLSLLVTGGAGTGKSTVLTTLLGLADPAERLVIVEDTRELEPDHPHVVRLEARPPNVEGAGEITLRELVRQGLRMRPDRLVVGEVRGAEVVDLLAALNTGHDGGAGTVHANAVADLAARLEALASAGGVDRAALHSRLAAAVHVVVHVMRGRDGQRQVAEVAVVGRGARELVEVQTALDLRSGSCQPGPGLPALARALAARGVEVPPCS
ncbi:MAG: TadA family conjugal transfer-associated ATPase [Sporichthyaceae bacterium]